MPSHLTAIRHHGETRVVNYLNIFIYNDASKYDWLTVSLTHSLTHSLSGGTPTSYLRGRHLKLVEDCTGHSHHLYFAQMSTTLMTAPVIKCDSHNFFKEFWFLYKDTERSKSLFRLQTVTKYLNMHANIYQRKKGSKIIASPVPHSHQQRCRQLNVWSFQQLITVESGASVNIEEATVCRYKYLEACSLFIQSMATWRRQEQSSEFNINWHNCASSCCHQHCSTLTTARHTFKGMPTTGPEATTGPGATTGPRATTGP